MIVIAWILVGTVVLAYACALIQKYAHQLATLTEDVALMVLAIGGVVVLVLILRYLFAVWFERFAIEHETGRAIRDLKKRTWEMDGQLSAANRTIDQNGNPVIPGAALSGGRRAVAPNSQMKGQRP